MNVAVPTPWSGDGTPDAFEVVLLGVAGGPVYWEGDRAGIATAIVVNGQWYLIDAGAGVLRQAAIAGLSCDALRAAFVTHLHSDHVVDLPNILTYGWWEASTNPSLPIPIYGPEGLEDAWAGLVEAFARDIRDRETESLLPSLGSVFQPRNVQVPPLAAEAITEEHPDPPMEPILVHSDENVTVHAVLVRHPPMVPAFAFRFTMAGGSVTVSGDTAPCANLVDLARDTDLLLHEVIDEAWLAEKERTAATPAELASVRHHRKAHTSTMDVLDVASQCGAGMLVLHHLVPGDRVDRRWLDSEDQGFRGVAVVGADLMRIAFRRGKGARVIDHGH